MSYFRPKQFIIFAAFVVFLILIFGIIFRSNKTSQPVVSSKIQVVATLFPIYDFAKNIGQDKVDVSLLLPPGVEAHSFEPKPNDIIRINHADIFIYTNKFMEPWVNDLLSGITNKNLLITDASKGVFLISQDPHIWLDLTNAQTMVDTITQALITKDPSNKNFYEANAQIYKQKLSNLDQIYQSILKSCQTKEIIYGGHYAFGYLAARYGLHYSSAQGISPDSEPTAKDLIDLIDNIKRDNVKYIFYEELSSPKIANTISSETGAKLLFLNAAHNISKEQLNQNVSFISILENNLSNLKTGLQCQ
jgi:zinc transport system substrate-binding protein